MAELLLVDNDARLASLLARYLERRGHRVRTAGSFAAARALLAEAPDLLLSDVDLGGESGPVELERLAREGRLPPTLVVSGFLDAGLVRELERIPGVRGTLAKPFEPAELERRVRALLAELAASSAPAGDAPLSAGAEERALALEGGPSPDEPCEAGSEDEWVELLPLEEERA